MKPSPQNATVRLPKEEENEPLEPKELLPLPMELFVPNELELLLALNLTEEELLEPEREELLEEGLPQFVEHTGSVSVQNGPARHDFAPLKSTQQNFAEDVLLELLEPLLEDDEEEIFVHFGVHTGNESGQEEPVKQVLKPPTITQQKPAEEELLEEDALLEELELEPEREELEELLEPEREELLEEDLAQFALQTGSVCVQNGPSKQEREPLKSTQQ